MEWNTLHGSSPILTVSLAGLANPLRNCLEAIGVQNVAGVYFYSGFSCLGAGNPMPSGIG